MPDRRGHTFVLLVAAGAWTAWCLVSSAVVSLAVRLAGIALRRADVASDVLLAVMVEVVLLGVTAYVLFRVLARYRPPAAFWLVAPGGYLASFAIYLAVEWLTASATVSMTPAVLLEVATVGAIVSAGAYLGLLRRTPAAGRPEGDG